MTTNSSNVKALSTLFTASIFFAIIHFLLIEYVLPEIYGAGAYWAIYIFLVPMSLIVILSCNRKYKKDQTAVGKTFMFFVSIKIVASLLFLSPWIFWKTPFTIPFTKQFFCLFFCLLLVEVILLVRLLSNPSAEK